MHAKTANFLHSGGPHSSAPCYATKLTGEKNKDKEKNEPFLLATRQKCEDGTERVKQGCS